MFQDIKQLNRAALLIMQRLAVDDVLSAEVLFGVSKEVADLIKTLSLEDLESITNVTLPLVVLRNGDDLKFWHQLTTAAKDHLDPNGEMIQLATTLRMADKQRS